MVVNLTSCKHPYAGAVSGYPNIIPWTPLTNRKFLCVNQLFCLFIFSFLAKVLTNSKGFSSAVTKKKTLAWFVDSFEWGMGMHVRCCKKRSTCYCIFLHRGGHGFIADVSMCLWFFLKKIMASYAIHASAFKAIWRWLQAPLICAGRFWPRQWNVGHILAEILPHRQFQTPFRSLWKSCHTLPWSGWCWPYSAMKRFALTLLYAFFWNNTKATSCYWCHCPPPTVFL